MCASSICDLWRGLRQMLSTYCLPSEATVGAFSWSGLSSEPRTPVIRQFVYMTLEKNWYIVLMWWRSDFVGLTLTMSWFPLHVYPSVGPKLAYAPCWCSTAPRKGSNTASARERPVVLLAVWSVSCHNRVGHSSSVNNLIFLPCLHTGTWTAIQ